MPAIFVRNQYLADILTWDMFSKAGCEEQPSSSPFSLASVPLGARVRYSGLVIPIQRFAGTDIN